jgi:hypothetical protein
MAQTSITRTSASLTLDGHTFTISDISYGVAEAREMQAEVAEQIREDFMHMMDAGKQMAVPIQWETMPSAEALRALFERATNPTPADKAAAMLNWRAAADKPRALMPWTGTPEWLEIRRAVKRIRRNAPAYVISRRAMWARH